ncbi:MAG TPA: site-specific DNA-methyltransferase, partial [Candidatus Absconditabacterales bacterium]|nr:site-specific DNA-methyltransferase [Candidatus Absconditabacterales bacterium]
GKPRGRFTNEEGIRCRGTGIGNVRHYTQPFFKMQENTEHPTQKPELMIERIILTSSNEGDTILDPFMGSGTTAVACINTNRNFIGFELDKGYREIANKRISNLHNIF